MEKYGVRSYLLGKAVAPPAVPRLWVGVDGKFPLQVHEWTKVSHRLVPATRKLDGFPPPGV